jgi:hypothetical protein
VIQNKDVQVSASIEETKITIFGFTCPKCKVELSNPYTYAITYSDDKGYYIFNKLIIPKKFSDLCLTTIDKNNNHSAPNCIAPPPVTKYSTDIGPVLLSPSIKLTKDTASGESFPNSPLNIHLFKQAHAYSLPIITTSTDEKGHYEINIPNQYQSNFRLYTTANYQNNNSPRSNTLIYHLPISNEYWLYIFLPILIILLTFLFHWILKKHFSTIKSWPALRNIQLLPFSSFLSLPSSTLSTKPPNSLQKQAVRTLKTLP